MSSCNHIGGPHKCAACQAQDRAADRAQELRERAALEAREHEARLAASHRYHSGTDVERCPATSCTQLRASRRAA